jgi:3-phenylpropionate/trans-cinnamate dioxygenase ferredoxin subunit
MTFENDELQASLHCGQHMPRHVVAKAADLPSGARKLVAVGTRSIVIFNIKGELFALSSRCPHKGGDLSKGRLTGLVTSSAPGHYDYTRPGEIIRCPWHAWEFDVRTGRSWCDPKRLRLVNYNVSIEAGAKLVEGPYVAETFPVVVEDDYVVVETK